MDPHIFADPDPDPGSQNLADPKHCLELFHRIVICSSEIVELFCKSNICLFILD